MAEVEGTKGNVQVDLEKYTELVLKVDEAQDKINEMNTLRKELAIATAAAKPQERFSFGACDLITAFWDMDLKISDTIYTSFVVVTLGAFGISEAGKAFSKQ